MLGDAQSMLSAVKKSNLLQVRRLLPLKSASVIVQICVNEDAESVAKVTGERNDFALWVRTEEITIWLRCDLANLEALGAEALEKVGAFAKAGRCGK